MDVYYALKINTLPRTSRRTKCHIHEIANSIRHEKYSQTDNPNNTFALEATQLTYEFCNVQKGQRRGNVRNQ